MTYKQHINATIRLSVPVAIGQAGYVLMGLVDSLMIGKLGAVSLAASSLGNQIFFLHFVVGLGFSMVLSPLVAMSKTVGDHKKCGIYFRQSFFVNMVLGFLLALILIGTTFFYQHLDQALGVAAEASSYTRILAFSLIPIMFFQSYKQFLEGLSIMKPAMVFVLLANVVNVFINWALIFGNLGMPALGLDGAGYATFGSRLFMYICIVFYISYRKEFAKYSLSLKRFQFHFDILKKLLRLGVPSGGQYFFEITAFSGATIMVGWISAEALAAHQIGLSLISISYVIITGVASTAAVRVGNAVGKKDIEETRKAGFTALILSTGIMGVYAIFLLSLRNILPAFYIENPEVIEITSGILIIAGFWQLFDGGQAIGLGILRGLTDVSIPTVITIISYWLIGIPACYILGIYFNYGVHGVWIAFGCSLLTSALLLNIRFWFKSKTAIQPH